MPNVTMSVMLTNAIGLHARPSLKLTQLAKTFAGAVEIALSPEGPWINAKSPVSVMRARRAAPCCMFVPNGPAAVTLVAGQFDEDHANTCSSSGDD